jgi:Flp pilus assembly pilin Flp
MKALVKDIETAIIAVLVFWLLVAMGYLLGPAVDEIRTAVGLLMIGA